MKTTDIFKTKAKKLNESFEKTFGKKLKLETFTVPQLEDARNRLRTQIHQVRNGSNFNETVENEAYTKAQWMLDNINAELAERFEQAGIQAEGAMDEIAAELGQVADNEDYDKLYDLLSDSGPVGKYLQDQIDDITGETGLHPKDDIEKIEPMLMDRIQQEFGGNSDDEGGETDDSYALASAGFGSDEDYESIQTELSTNTLKSYQDKAGKDIVNTMTSGDHMTTDKSAKKVMNRMRGSEKADNKIYKKENESINPQEEQMTQFRESAADKAGAVVVAKDMTDKVSRWIEELSGMENDTLLSLGDTIRDEMGQEQAKAYLEAVAPAIQQALQNLKTTRETLATGMRGLTGEAQPAEIIGSEPEEGGAEDMAKPATPDEMNMPAEEPAADEFAAAEPASGAGAPGREQRESINRQNRLLKVLAG